MDPANQQDSPFRQLIDIITRLRSPDGCPWDREQTHETLKKYILEEAHEVCQAIDDGDDAELCVELGDLTLQIVFQAQIAGEEGRFDIQDVLRAICEKLISRHPHVFGDLSLKTSAEVLANWERIKADERSKKEHPASILDGVPRTLPALHRSQRIQEKAANVGFDWKSAEEAFPKIEEEIRELRSAMSTNDMQSQADELGDILFSIVNVVRLKGFHAEELLQAATDKFQDRFRNMERILEQTGKIISQMTLQEMDVVWNQIKESEKLRERPGLQ